MKKKNREALRTALSEFHEEYRAYMEQVGILMEMSNGGIQDDARARRYNPSSGQDWEIRLDILEETIERVLEDER